MTPRHKPTTGRIAYSNRHALNTPEQEMLCQITQGHTAREIALLNAMSPAQPKCSAVKY